MDLVTLDYMIAGCFCIAAFFIWLSFYPSNLNFLMERIDEGNNFHSRAVKSEDRSFAILRLFLPLAQKISKKNAGKIKKDSLDKMSKIYKERKFKNASA